MSKPTNLYMQMVKCHPGACHRCKRPEKGENPIEPLRVGREVKRTQLSLRPVPPATMETTILQTANRTMPRKKKK